MKRLWILAAAFLPARSRATAALAAGNAEAGAAKAAVCQACHGANGNSVNPEWPSLAGLGADYIAEQLQNFKSGKRNNPIMMGNVLALTPEDMADLGRLFRQTGEYRPGGGSASWRLPARRLYRGGDKARGIPACMACHGPTGRRNRAGEVSAVARTAFRVCRQAIDRLCVGCADLGSERNHADDRQAIDGRRHPQPFLLRTGTAVKMRATCLSVMVVVALALGACGNRQSADHRESPTTPATALAPPASPGPPAATPTQKQEAGLAKAEPGITGHTNEDGSETVEDATGDGGLHNATPGGGRIDRGRRQFHGVGRAGQSLAAAPVAGGRELHAHGSRTAHLGASRASRGAGILLVRAVRTAMRSIPRSNLGERPSPPTSRSRACR